MWCGVWSVNARGSALTPCLSYWRAVVVVFGEGVEISASEFVAWTRSNVAVQTFLHAFTQVRSLLSQSACCVFQHIVPLSKGIPCVRHAWRLK